MERPVDIALRFLQDPAVRDSGDEKKRAFLLSKGLGPQEIDEALSRCHSPPLPQFNVVQQQGQGMVRHYKHWLFLLLLGVGTVFYYYRRIVLGHVKGLQNRARQLIQCGIHQAEADRLKRIEDKIGSLEAVYKYLQAEIEEIKRHKGGKKPPQ